VSKVDYGLVATLLLVSFIAGFGFSSIIRSVAGDSTMIPHWLNRITHTRVMAVLTVILALSTMLTLYTSVNCQTIYGQNLSDRSKILSDESSAVNKARIDALNALIDAEDAIQARQALAKERDALVSLEEERANNPVPNLIGC
jgi:hypothetical protein